MRMKRMKRMSDDIEWDEENVKRFMKHYRSNHRLPEEERVKMSIISTKADIVTNQTFEIDRGGDLYDL